MTREEAIFTIEHRDSIMDYGETEQLAEALDMALEALKAEPCGDAVSRKWLLEQFAAHIASGYAESAYDAQIYTNLVNGAPSVTPERPKGKWISYNWNDNGIARWGIKCDKCLKKYKYGGEIWEDPNFCPNCGADMREENDEE